MQSRDQSAKNYLAQERLTSVADGTHLIEALLDFEAARASVCK
jgi:hypothetical protein